MSSVDSLVDALVRHKQDCLGIEQWADVTRCVGLLVEARGLSAPIGAICWIATHRDALRIASGSHDAAEVACEVVGFDGDRSFLMPLSPTGGIQVGARIRYSGDESAINAIPEPDQLIGRVVDGLCRPLDDGAAMGKAVAGNRVDTINPLARHPITTRLDVGIGSLNGLLTIGLGQRMGLFAGSGVGKSVLLGMLARFVDVDVVVVGLIGERGREVREFISDNLGSGLSRSVVVACPADDSPALRIRGARLATHIAEQFRAQGKQVLLLMDSLTRVAQAQREIGLAMGEPPTSKGYTPSAFACLPGLVERSGCLDGGGSITAFYTVLMEEDDLQDPVVDASRAILDGHVVLSRQLADQGLYPAVDVGSSVSRVMHRVVSDDASELARRFRALWQCYKEQFDLISVGAYQHGSHALTDEAIARYDAMCSYLQQTMDECVDYDHALKSLQALFATPIERTPAATLDMTNLNTVQISNAS